MAAKRGQITSFVLLGALIMFGAAALVGIVRLHSTAPVPAALRSAQAVESFTLSCVENTVVSGLAKTGYRDILGLESYVNSNLKSCTKRYGAFETQVRDGPVKTTITLSENQDSLVAEVKYPLEIMDSGSVVALSDFHYALMFVSSIEPGSGESRLMSGDGKATLFIPTGTDTSEPALQVRLADATEYPAPKGYALVSGVVYDFLPDQTSFSPDVKLKIYYDSDILLPRMPENMLSMLYFDGKEWAALDSQVAADENAVYAYISHFSAYAVAAPAPLGECETKTGVLAVPSAYSVLGQYYSDCSTDKPVGGECNLAIHYYCQQFGTLTGYGPTQYSGDTMQMVCMPEDTADIVQTTFTELHSYNDYCTSSSPISAHCNSAIDWLCRNKGYVSGFGPVQYLGNDAKIACVKESVSWRVETAYDALKQYHPGCSIDNPYGGPCNSAIDYYCRNRGFASGFGPAQYSGSHVEFVCLASDIMRYYEETFTELNKYHTLCTPDNPVGGPCNSAIDWFCKNQLYGSGFGPVQYENDTAHFACVAYDVMQQYKTVWEELTSLNPGCSPYTATSDSCSSAIDFMCKEKGFMTGFGPVQYLTDEVHAACVNRNAGVVVETDYSTLNSHHPLCNATVPFGGYCNSAVDSYCKSLGYGSGFGPVQHENSTAIIACIKESGAC